MERYEDHISQRSIKSTMSTILPARFALQFSALKTAITNTMVKSTATSTIQLNLRNDVMDVKQQFSSSLWRYSVMGKISIGTLNAT